MERVHPLTVRPQVDQKKRYRQPKFSQLGPTPMRMALISPTGFGKTSAGLTAANALIPIMDRIHVFSGTIDADPSLAKFKTDIKAMLRAKGVDYGDKLEEPFHSSLADLDLQLQEAAKRSKEAADLGGTSQTLFFIDDLLQEYRGHAATKTLEKLFYSGRHYGISILILSQVWRALSPIVRKQLSHIALWNGPVFETEAVKEEVSGGGLDGKTFDTAFKVATEGRPHGFMLIKMGNPPELFSSFTKRIVRQ